MKKLLILLAVLTTSCAQDSVKRIVQSDNGSFFKMSIDREYNALINIGDTVYTVPNRGKLVFIGKQKGSANNSSKDIVKACVIK